MDVVSFDMGCGHPGTVLVWPSQNRKAIPMIGASQPRSHCGGILLVSFDNDILITVENHWNCS